MLYDSADVAKVTNYLMNKKINKEGVQNTQENPLPTFILFAKLLRQYR